MKGLKETHQKGSLIVENLNIIVDKELYNIDFGLQVARDGRVWICVDGIAFLRFKPEGMGFGKEITNGNK